MSSSAAMNGGGGFDAFGNPTPASNPADVNWASNDAFASAFDEPKSSVS